MASAESVESEPSRIKVWFRFIPDGGWLPLPYDTEGMWATPVSPDTARIDNVPFLQTGVAQDDVVRFTTDDDGIHWATGRVTASGNCTIRILPNTDGRSDAAPTPSTSACQSSTSAVRSSATTCHCWPSMFRTMRRSRRSKRC